MKPLFTLFTALFLLNISALSAQKNLLKLDLMHFAISETTVDHIGIEYFHTFKQFGQIGLKLMHSTDAFSDGAGAPTLSFSNLDLVRRWRLNKSAKRLSLSAEAGISALYSVEKWPPVESYDICPVPGMTQKDIDEQIYYFDEVLSKWQIKRALNFGLSGTFNAAYRISPLFSMGLGVYTNVFLNHENELQLLPMPQLKTAFSF